MKRVFLKLSGEALAGEKKTGFDEPTVTEVARQVKQIVDGGCQVGIVIGGGNFWRGRSSETIDRTKADQIGMLATIMNCMFVSGPPYSRSERYAGYGQVVHLCIGDLPFCRNENTDPDTVCMRSVYKTFLKRPCQ